MAYNDPYQDLYTPIKEDPNLKAWESIDPILPGFFGGNAAYNSQIDKRNAAIAAAKNQLGQQRSNVIDQTIAGNQADWDALKKSIFGDTGTKLSDFYSGVEGEDKAALGKLLGTLDNYDNAADLFKDPSFMQYVGDAKNAATISPETLANQRTALGKYQQLSTPTETAEEKFMRLMAQREAEANQRGDREAMAANLKARGAYGSGAELVSALMSQSSNAQNRALANAAANANASKRAMGALGSFSDLTNQMAGQQLQQGNLANQMAQFNNAARQGATTARANQQIAATQAGQNALAQRAGAGFGASQSVGQNKRSDVGAQNRAQTGITQAMTGNRTQGAGLKVQDINQTTDDLTKQQAFNEANRRDTGLLSGIF